MSLIILLWSSHVKKTEYFLKTHFLLLRFFVSSKSFTICDVCPCEERTPLEAFRVSLTRTTLHNVMCMHNCLSRFYGEFWACTCNIICKVVLLVKLGKRTGVFLTRSIHADSKSCCKNTKLKQEVCFKKI